MGTWDDLQIKNEEYQMGLNYEVGDIVTLKKAHPCGSKEWEILRGFSPEMQGLRTSDHGGT